MKIVTADIGTTKIKSMLIDVDEKDGLPRIADSVDINQQVVSSTPESHEHSPKFIVEALKSAIKHFTRNYGKPDLLVFSSYLFALALADDKEEYVSNIMTWLDERSKRVLDKIRPHASELYKRTGAPPLYIYSLPKILYLREYKPELLFRARYFLDSKSIITLHFLGYHVTDYSTASGTYQMLNVSTRKWDDLALELAGIDEKNLPELEEGDYVDVVRRSVARELEIDEKTPLVLSFYDGGAMIYVLTSSVSGIGVINMGTSAMIRVVYDKPVLDDENAMRFSTYYFYRGTWIPGGSISNAGIVLEHVIRLLNMNSNYAFDQVLYKVTREDILKRTPRPIVIPLLYPERIPLLGKDLGMSIVGIKPLNTNPGDILLSTLEGIAFLLNYSANPLRERGIDFTEVRVGGGITSIPAVQLILASIFNKPVSRITTPHVSLIGNASIALKAVDESLSNKLRYQVEAEIESRKVHPDPEIVEFYKEIMNTYNRYLDVLYKLEDTSTARSMHVVG